MILNAALVLAGAVLTIGSSAVTGLKLERWAAGHGCPLGNVGAPLGLLVGVVTVLAWFA
jgi:hypothetical protein